MANNAYKNQKRPLKFSKKQIDKAGRDIRHGLSGIEREEAIEKIQNFRETHLYPLMLIRNHISSATKKADKKGIVARRLKRLSTIIDKLERPTLDGNADNAIKLTRMQDIAGCRAIVSNLDQLKKLHKRLKDSRSVHQIIRTNDYLTPKDSGYSGIHLVYECFRGSEEDNEWKKTKVEVQLRTQLQHAWATSLEIIDTLESIKLKTSHEGHPEWRRFFKLAGDLVAHDIGAYELSQDNLESIRAELAGLEASLNVREKLIHYSMAIALSTDKRNLPRRVLAHQGLNLVELYKPENENGKLKFNVKLTTFGPTETEKAIKALEESEEKIDVMISVLVSAGDVRTLKKAYPNYFGSTDRFTKFLSKYIEPNNDKNEKNK